MKPRQVVRKFARKSKKFSKAKDDIQIMRIIDGPSSYPRKTESRDTLRGNDLGSYGHLEEGGLD
jgi:hypothetical protein